MRAALGRIAMWLIARLYRAYYATLRLHAILPDGSIARSASQYPFRSEVFALCERDAIAFGGVLTGRGFATLVAPGRDGDWAAALLEALGCRVIRGASRRGGAEALRTLVTHLRNMPEPLGLVVDGPLGPAGRAKRGGAVCALATGRPLCALGAAARHAVVIPNTWSGIYVPLPFTRVEIALEHLPIDPRLTAESNEDVTALTDALSDRLTSMRAEAIARAQQAGW